MHDILFRWVKKTFPLIKTFGLCATDGEKAIINSLDGIVNLRCWNHLISNIEQWTKRHQGHKHDWVFYKSEVKKILHQISKDDALQLYNESSLQWDPAFADYFENFVWPQVVSFGRWTLENINY